MKKKIKMSKIGKSLSLMVIAIIVAVSFIACARPKSEQQFTLCIGIFSTHRVIGVLSAAFAARMAGCGGFGGVSYPVSQ